MCLMLVGCSTSSYNDCKADCKEQQMKTCPSEFYKEESFITLEQCFEPNFYDKINNICYEECK